MAYSASDFMDDVMRELGDATDYGDPERAAVAAIAAIRGRGPADPLRAYVGHIIESWWEVLCDEAAAAVSQRPSDYDAAEVAGNALEDLAQLSRFIGRVPDGDAA